MDHQTLPPIDFWESTRIMPAPSGNITEIFDDAVPTEFFNGAVIEPRKRYVYDALYRLIEATGREHAGQLHAGLLAKRR